MIPIPDLSNAFGSDPDANDDSTEIAIALWAVVQRLDALIELKSTER